MTRYLREKNHTTLKSQKRW